MSRLVSFSITTATAFNVPLLGSFINIYSTGAITKIEVSIDGSNFHDVPIPAAPAEYAQIGRSGASQCRVTFTGTAQVAFTDNS